MNSKEFVINLNGKIPALLIVDRSKTRRGWVAKIQNSNKDFANSYHFKVVFADAVPKKLMKVKKLYKQVFNLNNAVQNQLERIAIKTLISNTIGSNYANIHINRHGKFSWLMGSVKSSEWNKALAVAS
jgi:hypothetical protein